MSFSLTEADVNGLSAEQKSALMEALLFAVLADGKVDPSIIERFDEETERIPWGLERDDLKKQMTDARSGITALKTPEEVEAKKKDIASKLVDSSLREKTFRAMTWIMGSGDLNALEKNVMVAFATVFEISIERLAAIKASLE